MAGLWAKVRSSLNYLDVGLAALLGVLFSVLGLVDVLGGEALIQATLALLAVLAFSLLRDRVQREQLGVGLRKFNSQIDAVKQDLVAGLRSVQDNVQALQSEFPYHTNSLEASWEIATDDGCLAYMTRRREIRFLQNDVASIHEFAAPAGKDKDYTAQGGHVGMPLHDLPVIERAFFDHRGRELTLISLQGLWKIGEMMQLETRRTIQDSFTGKNEFVKLAIVSPTDSAVMRVTWPAGRPPDSVVVQRTKGKPRRKSIEASKLARVDGRPTYSEDIADPQDGEEITLSWFW